MDNKNTKTDNSPSAILAQIRQERSQREARNHQAVGEVKTKTYSIEDLMDC